MHSKHQIFTLKFIFVKLPFIKAKIIML